jgi:hypothetical protein
MDVTTAMGLMPGVEDRADDLWRVVVPGYDPGGLEWVNLRLVLEKDYGR